jgi:hypothetical protein
VKTDRLKRCKALKGLIGDFFIPCQPSAIQRKTGEEILIILLCKKTSNGKLAKSLDDKSRKEGFRLEAAALRPT